jgi:hypothetical protein
VEQVPNWMVVTAAVERVNQWVVSGRPAPTAPRLEIDTTTNPPTLKRDTAGRAVGGIRLPQFAAPIADNRAINFGPGFCTLAGSHRFYTAEELRRRYGSHGRYVAQVGHAALEVARAGFILPHEARSIIVQAALSDVGR